MRAKFELHGEPPAEVILFKGKLNVTRGERNWYTFEPISSSDNAACDMFSLSDVPDCFVCSVQTASAIFWVPVERGVFLGW